MNDLDLEPHYRSGSHDLSRDFFQPCLARAVRYDRAAGYFSSSALLTWVDALPRMAEGDLRVRLIASPELDRTDADAVAAIQEPRARREFETMLVDRVLDEIAALADRPDDVARRARVFGWLVANGRLELRFAFPRHVAAPGIFHEKFGVFEFEGGALAAFTGSANETAGGHVRNYESIDVYRGWLPGEETRTATKRQQFEESWEGRSVGLDVVPPSPEAVARLVVRTRRAAAPQPEEPRAPTDERWRHQDEAIAAFLDSPAGILEMATGTGKTRTSIRILDLLARDGGIDAAIVTVEGVDLLDQWADELQAWAARMAPRWLIYRQFGPYRDAAEFALDPSRSVLVISRARLAGVLARLDKARRSRLLVVHDEVHGLGTPALVRELAGMHEGVAFRLGLSATPERAYDDVGNRFITDELGPTLYRFPLEAAIARGVLSEFDYLPLGYQLTQSDRDRLKQVYSRQAARAREGNPMSREEVWTELARVYKTAEMKVDVFAEHLRGYPEVLERCIVFVEQKEYGQRILEIVHGYTHRYRTYYAEDDREHLVQFARGEIDTLITCHRISQGIDIRSLRSVVLFASARAKLETIQRIGRCLRTDPANPGKRALVVDFVRPDEESSGIENADQERCAWLSELAKVRRGDPIGTG